MSIPEKQTKSILNTPDPSNTSTATLIREFTAKAYHLDPLGNPLDHPIYGTTIYIANCKMELRFGVFQAFIFQDIIRSDYIVALTYGDTQNADLLYTRMHSSCVTSETLRGRECDCVHH